MQVEIFLERNEMGLIYPAESSFSDSDLQNIVS